jgi:hypothetical protein
VLEGFIIALVLIGVGRGERRDGLIEGVALSEVLGDRDPVARASMGARERPTAELAIGAERARVERVEVRRALPAQSWRQK